MEDPKVVVQVSLLRDILTSLNNLQIEHFLEFDDEAVIEIKGLIKNIKAILDLTEQPPPDARY